LCGRTHSTLPIHPTGKPTGAPAGAPTRVHTDRDQRQADPIAGTDLRCLGDLYEGESDTITMAFKKSRECSLTNAQRQLNKHNGILPSPAPPADIQQSTRTSGSVGSNPRRSGRASVRSLRVCRSGVSLGPIDEDPFNPEHTFETFVVSSHNRFAHAASVAVAESPARAYSPLFIYGGSGVGKTHLLHAIGQHATALGTARFVRYVPTQQFTNDLINSLRHDKIQAFQRRYRDLELLLIDDIRFLEGHDRAQEEFFHTFNDLHNANKQIVISSDRMPRRLHTLDNRLRTRFEWGLLADIQPPNTETRNTIPRTS
jgi:chromosomal replication initiator protein